MDYNELSSFIIESVSENNIKNSIILVLIFTGINIVITVINYFLNNRQIGIQFKKEYSKSLKGKECELVKTLYLEIENLCMVSFKTMENEEAIATS